MPKGIVQFFIEKKGYGYIRVPESREEFHFTQRHLEGTVTRGTAVYFKIKEDRHGLHAIQVRPIENAEKD